MIMKFEKPQECDERGQFKTQVVRAAVKSYNNLTVPLQTRER